MAEVIGIVGGQSGDEGKGKIIDLLSEKATHVIRAQGGDNAGHTVINNHGEFALHLVPSGIFNPDAISIIGPGVVTNPRSLLTELNMLEEKKISTENLRISRKSHLVFDYHITLDSAEETARGAQEIGTTRRGMGPVHSDKVRRIGLRAEDLLNPSQAMDKLASVLKQKRNEFKLYEDHSTFQPDFYEQQIKDSSARLSSQIVDTDIIVNQALQRSDRKILLEGAQATLLSIDHGAYPYVTSSDPTINGLLLGSGVPASCLTDTIGVFKAYFTRVGSGAMPTELLNSTGDLIRQKGHEYGTTTGRPRRVGNFDGVAAKYADMLNRFSKIAITKVDILTGIDDLKINSLYRNGERVVKNFPASDEEWAKLSPLYEENDYFKSWDNDISEASSWEELSAECQQYLSGIMSSFRYAELSHVGIGPKREQTISIKKPKR